MLDICLHLFIYVTHFQNGIYMHLHELYEAILFSCLTTSSSTTTKMFSLLIDCVPVKQMFSLLVQFQAENMFL